jgi:ribose transport system ATP-binding protein
MALGMIGRGRARLVAGGMVLACALAAGCSEGDPVSTDRGGPGAQVEMDTLRIRTAASQDVGHLSGGNQQKVVLGRWLTVGPRVLVLDEPTRGVDIGAKYEIYRIINEQVRRGVAVLVVSSDLPEALGISDRVLVVRGGRIVAELDRSEATEEAVMLHATGVAASAEKNGGTPR